MENELRILILDDTPTDAELMEHELRKSGLVFTSQRVDTRDTFIRALDEFRPDIVLADYSLPDFDGLSALKIVQHHDPDMPTIMVTGALSDVQAVELLKEGARDYVLKSGLARLPSAIRKVVSEEREVRARKEAEKALRESEELFRSVALNASDAIVVIRGPDGVVDIWNKKAEEMFGYAASEAVGKVVHRFIAPDRYREKSAFGVKRFFETGEGDVIGKTLVLFALRRDGSEFPVELSVSSMKIGDEWRATAIVRDVTERKKMEVALRESEAKFHRIVENAPFVLGICDLRGNIHFINKRHERMFGYPIAKVPTVRDWMAWAYPDEEYRKQVIAQWNDDIRRALNGEFTVPPTRVYRVTSADGTVRDVEITFSLMDELMYVLFYDVTERVRGENEIRKLIHAIEQSPVSVVITDKDGDIQYVNKKFCEMTGYAKEEAIGKNPRILKSGEQSQEFYKELWDTILAGKEWHGEFHNKKKSGDLYWENAVISSVKGAEGNIVHLIGIKEDISEKKSVQEALRDSEEKYRQFFTAESDAIILIDGETKRFVDANEATLNLFQYTREEFLNLGPMNISVEPEETKEVFEKLDRGGIVRVPLRYLKKKDGSVFPAEAFAGSFMLKGRKIFFGVFRDITQRMEDERKLKFAEMQLMLSEKLAGIGQLSAGVCHEILNPLNIISIQTQLLLKREEGNPILTEKLTKIMGEVGRINKIVGSLMTFARKGFPELKPVQINAELDAALSLVEKDFNLDNIKIARDYRSPLPEIKIDTDEMRQVFLNLINNARYEMRGGGTLTVKTRLEKVGDRDHVRICFCDTGSGIKKEHLTKIFNPFFTTKPEGKGTGMGLSMAHSIVEKHGGTIIAESEEGKGAAFIIDLPLDK